MSLQVVLRPLQAGDFSEPHTDEAEYDDFGPRSGYATPPPSRLDDDGALAVVVDGEPCGVVSWRWQQWGPNQSSRNPMIGIRLNADARGRGIGTIAQRMLVDLIFRHVATNRVEAHTDVENLAEQRALTKAGFTQEGTTRGAQWRHGAYRDGFMYSMLRAEWDGS